ncbi:MAG: penicillin-binding protein activator [Marinobacter sp.]|uniref:penicillin-binding protein activator n=1 Tax=Marinobacter sp. TaxID=50741 RepID=UPI00299CF609|nr:penicillin-binding protein activator [Marinobacter sp.]MDX1757867.1 penicillin-binding protein activator [Marinobacter sp.]
MKTSSLKMPLLAVLAATLLASGCSSVNLNTHTPTSAAEAVSLAASESDRQTAQSYLLRTAESFQLAGDHEGARRILTSEPLASPIPELRNLHSLLSMTSAVALQDRPWAEALAEGMSRDQFLGYDPQLSNEATNLQASVFLLAGRPLDSALTLMSLADQGLTDNLQPIHDRIWQTLKQTPDDSLAAASQRAIGYGAQGWLELAAIMRQPGISLDDQGRSIREWQYNWTGHPAANTLPSELQLITTLVQQRPEKIALTLPLSGDLANAGAAIRDGFLAAFYSDDSARDFEVEITVVDTHGKSFEELYQDMAASYDLVVGPLRKPLVAELTQRETLPTPVLALNYLPDNQSAPQAMYQFGLAAEDEARQIANRLHQEQRPQALVLIPTGDWGDRFEQALRTGMTANQGTALNTIRYLPSENFRAVTADLLGITESRQRAIDVERTIGLNVEFEPRRRQDADAIVMVATPTIARQFKPLFAFYFAGDLPVYSPSLVYEGYPDASRDRDLNQVRFTDTPWVLAEDNPFRDRAVAAFDNIGGQLGRLFAMGTDAYKLSTRLPLLENVEGSMIEGQTGQLSMAENGSVHRTQLWAQFVNGTPRLLPEPAGGEETPTPTRTTSEQAPAE